MKDRRLNKKRFVMHFSKLWPIFQSPVGAYYYRAGHRPVYDKPQSCQPRMGRNFIVPCKIATGLKSRKKDIILHPEISVP